MVSIYIVWHSKKLVKGNGVKNMNLNRLPKVSLRTDFFRIKLKKITKNGGEKMKWERFSCLQEKEVINICDGRRLGCACDLEMDAISGKICTLIIPECGSKWNFFGKERAFFVPWRCIRRIGDDIILVEVDGEEILRTDGD